MPKKKASQSTTSKNPKCQSEHLEQVGYVNWFRNRYPDKVIYAIPNGDMRSMTVAKKLVLEGVTAGVLDLEVLLEWGQTLRVEMKKVVGGVLSQEQKDFISYLDDLGHHVIVGYGAADASAKTIAFFEWFYGEFVGKFGKNYVNTERVKR